MSQDRRARTDEPGQTSQDRRARTDEPGQRSQDRGVRTEVPGQRSQDRGASTEEPGQRSQDRGARTEVPGQRCQDRGARTEEPGQTIVSIWRKNMLGCLSTDITCSEKRTVFRECSLRKTVSFKEQIMSKDKYPSIFLPQMETIVFIILQIFYATHTVLKIEGYSRISPSFSCWIFGHVT